MITSKTTQNGIRKWRWQFAVRQLRDAYHLAKSAIDGNIQQIQKDHDKFGATPTPDPEDYDEVESHYAWESSLTDRWDQAHSSLQSTMQSFSVLLYHLWERNSSEWIGWKKNYRFHYVAPQLKELGYSVANGVFKLNDVANCVKHDSDELWKRNDSKDMFDPIVAEIVAEGGKPEYARYLRLTDSHMEEFFDALMQSGPPGPATPSL